MERVFELAGWCASRAFINLLQNFESRLAPNESALLPELVVQSDEKRSITVLEEATRETTQQVELLLEKLSPSNRYAVLTSDANIKINERSFDAVVLRGYLLCQPRQEFVVALPYERPDGQSFALHNPRLLSHDGFSIESADASNAFNRGRDSHQEGAAIWRDYFRTDAQ